MNPNPDRKANNNSHLPILFKHGAGEKDTDYAVWEAFKSGNKIAFDYIFSGNIKMLYKYGTSVTSDRDLVADCIQELFISLWDKREVLGNTNSIRFYLFTSLRRRIVRKLENENKRLQSDLNDVDNEHYNLSSETEIIMEEEEVAQKKHIVQALSSLTKRQHEAITLRYYKQLSFEQIAHTMQLDIASVRNILSKGITNLRLQCVSLFRH